MGAQPVITSPIPYERQSNVETNRTCGAACLSMVYRSYGQKVPQEEIWEVIAKVNRFGSLASTTHLMVGDALKRGFDAVAVKARHPIFALRSCHEANVRVILNHRLNLDVPTGHYSVLADIDDRMAALHDPYFGPARRMTHNELMRLWDAGADSEITGEVLIAISPPDKTAAVCEICQTPIPAAVPCPQCGKPVGLRPAIGIGCINERCIARRWLHVCCPNCDYMWNFTAAAPPAPKVAAEKPEEAEDPFQLAKVFEGIDKFCAAITAIPLAAGNADVMKCLDAMRASQEKLTEAAAQQLAMYKAQMDKLEALVQKSQQAQEAHKKQVEALTTPSPPLDGDALGQALLKNMGLIK